MPEDRRHAAIMFTDIVGYTTLMGRDEDAAFDMLSRNHSLHEALISKHNGILIKEIGDGTLASFPLASNAVRCAMDIQKEAKDQKIPLKIGIHEGEMVFAGGDVLGDGVNIASRLQEEAQGGCINISASVYRDIKNKADIQTTLIGEKSFKNVDEAIKVYRVYLEKIGIKEKPAITPNEESLNSIAVLPFVNMSNDPDQEYFCDGMTEEIINALTYVENLKVIARTSAFMFKGKHEDMREIGKRLGVVTLLEGSVRKEGTRLRITAQLIKVFDGSHIWSKRYDRNLEDIFDIQDELSLSIVDNLKVKFLENEKRALVKRSSENIEAYNLYLMGVHHLLMLSDEGYNKANYFFKEALKNDSKYSLAYIGLASVPYFRSFWGNIPPNEAFPIVKEFANKALEIDSTLAEAFCMLGNFYMYYEWNFEKAVEQFRKALMLNKNSSMAHSSYSYILSISGLNEEANTKGIQALKLDPLSPIYNTFFGQLYFNAKQYDRQIEEQQRTIAMHPNYFMSYFHLGTGYRGKLMFEEAIIEYKKAIDLSGAYALIVAWLAYAYFETGEKDMAESLIRNLEKRKKHEYISPTCFFPYFLLKGDKEKAYQWLQKGIEERDGLFPFWISMPIKEYRIPDEPRFNNLLKKSGLWKR